MKTTTQRKPIFCNTFPKDYYGIALENGDDGLLVKLLGERIEIHFNFGYNYAMRMLDEGMVQSNIYGSKKACSNDADEYINVIYETEHGEFYDSIKNISQGMWDTFDNLKQYTIVSLNFCVDIISDHEPIFSIKTLEQQ